MGFLLYFFGGFILFAFIMIGVFVPLMIKMNERRKKEKHARKMEQQKVAAEIEMQKMQTAFNIEKGREEMKPRFCPYCGTKHDAKAEKCPNCGADL